MSNFPGLERDPELVSAGTYERVVAAGIASVWENVFDWEHLPWLHESAFSSIALQSSGEWGWHATVGFSNGETAEIRLVVDSAKNRYVSRTVSGFGAPGEIWTALKALSADETGVSVEFRVPKSSQADLARAGKSLSRLYAQLWDEDESMILARERVAALPQDAGAKEDEKATEEIVDLGPRKSLLSRLPIQVNFGGHGFRLVEIEGRLYAHAVECPHWRGPLDRCAVDAGIVTCPWHGYRFEVESGRSADERGLKLRPAPRVKIDSGTDHVFLVAQD